MLIVDQRFLEAIEILKDLGIVSTKQEICNSLNIFKSNVAEIRNQDRNNKVKHFTVEQITSLIEIYGIDPSWLFGYSTKTFRTTTAQKLHKFSTDLVLETH